MKEEITVVRQLNVYDMFLCLIHKNWLIYFGQNTTNIFIMIQKRLVASAKNITLIKKQKLTPGILQY